MNASWAVNGKRPILGGGGCIPCCQYPPGFQELCKSQQYRLHGNLCEGCVSSVVVHTNDDHMRKPALYE